MTECVIELRVASLGSRVQARVIALKKTSLNKTITKLYIRIQNDRSISENTVPSWLHASSFKPISLENCLLMG